MKQLRSHAEGMTIISYTSIRNMSFPFPFLGGGLPEGDIHSLRGHSSSVSPMMIDVWNLRDRLQVNLFGAWVYDSSSDPEGRMMRKIAIVMILGLLFAGVCLGRRRLRSMSGSIR